MSVLKELGIQVDESINVQKGNVTWIGGEPESMVPYWDDEPEVTRLVTKSCKKCKSEKLTDELGVIVCADCREPR